MGVDTVIKSAHILTMEEACESRDAARRGVGVLPEAIAIHAGRIQALGSNADILALSDPGTRVLDLAGKTVLPGFIDSHVHFTQAGLGSLGPQLYGITSHAQALEVISDAVGKVPRGAALLVHGCSLEEFDIPLEWTDLDRLAPHNPLMVGDVGAHACVVNTSAWNALGLSADAPGVVRGQDGKPVGVLRGATNTRARYDYYNDVIDDATRKAALHRASRLALEAGITTVHALEGGTPDGRGWLPQRDVEVLLEEQNQLPVRTVVYFQSTRVDLAGQWGLPRIGGCVWVDGSYGERTAALLEPYTDEPCTCGCLYFSQDESDEFVWKAHLAGLQVSMHAIGDAAIEQLLTAYERALYKEPRADHRHRIEHFSLPTESQIERVATLGIVAAMQPNFAQHPPIDAAGLPGTGASQRGLEGLLGSERFRRRHPYRRLFDAGIVVAGGSDADPKPMGPLIGIGQLASHPEEARHLSPYEALVLYTRNAAWAAFEEKDKGTLAVGKLADLVVLGDNPLTAPASEIAGIPVELTLVGGHIRHER